MSSGLGTPLYNPFGASAVWLESITRPEDGAPVDLTLATSITRYFRASPTTADAEAEFALTVANGGIVVIDATAGLIKSILTATQADTLVPFAAYFTDVKVVFPADVTLIPDLLRRYFYNDLASLESQVCDGVTITRLDASTGTLTPVAPVMSNLLAVRYDLTGLIGGTAVKLDGLSAATLALLANGSMVRLCFPGSIVADFRLRLNTGAETELNPWRILCDNAPTRLWELVTVTKDAAPCLWDPGNSNFRQQIMVGGVQASADASFTLPA